MFWENSYVLGGEIYCHSTAYWSGEKPKMQFEKKLILCSILAVAIGISTIAPLTFLMTPASAQPSVDRPAFKFDMSYAYVRNVWDNNTLTNDTYGWAFSVIFKTAPNFDLTDDSVAYYETYRVELSSDGTSIGNITLSAMATTGINGPPANFTFFLNDWYIFTILENDKGPVGREGPYNGTALNFKHGYDDNWNLSTAQPETLTMKIYRQNTIMRTLNTTEIYSDENPEPIMQYQLIRYRDGYLYNTAIPMQELDQINPFFARPKMP